MANLTTLAAVKSFLEMTSTDVVRDAKIEAIIPRVSAWFEGQVGRHIGSASYSLLFSGDGSARLMLPEYPVSSVTAVEVDGVAIPGRSTVTGTGWVLGSASVGELLLAGHAFGSGTQNVKVEWVAGYASNAIPGDIERAVIQMIALDFKESMRIGVQTESSFGSSVSFLPSIIPQAVKDVIARYRSPL